MEERRKQDKDTLDKAAYELKSDTRGLGRAESEIICRQRACRQGAGP